MMDKWTLETVNALEEYLAEVERLAIAKGDDAEEIVSGLREHIVRETEEAAGEVVTLDHVRKTLASVGTPEMVIGIDEEEREVLLQSSRPESEAPPVPPVRLPPAGESVPQGSQRFMLMGKGCMFWAIGTAVAIPVGLVLLSILSIVAAIVLPAIGRARSEAYVEEEKGKIREVLETILDVQEQFHAENAADHDGDGIADYGTLRELYVFAPDVIFEGLGLGGSQDNYEYKIIVTESGKDGEPHFLCRVKPKSWGALYLTATATEKAEIRFFRDETEEGTVRPGKEVYSDPLNGDDAENGNSRLQVLE